MRFILNTAIGLFSAMFAAALAVVFQADIAAFFGRAPVVVSGEIVDWKPYPATVCADNRGKNCVDPTRADDTKMLQLRIKNRSGEDLENIIIHTEFSFGDFDVYIASGEKSLSKRSLFKVRRAELGKLKAADEMIVYAWSENTFERFSTDQLYVTTKFGTMPLAFRNLTDDEDTFPSVDTDTILWILFAIALFTSGIVIIVATTFENFTKGLLVDEDYYLQEKIKFDQNPKKYVITEIPKNVADKVKAL